MLIPLLFFLSSLGYAADMQVFTEDNERIMELRLDDGTLLSRGSIAYEVNRVWYLGLGELSDALGFAIQVSSHHGKASGYFLSETRGFLLETSKCAVKIKGVLENFDCKAVIARGEEIFVESRLLEKWFPLQFKMDTYRSSIQIKALEKLPEQLRKEREALLLSTQSQAFVPDSGLQKVETPNQIFSYPFFDQQLSFTRQFSPDGNSNRFQHMTEIGNEMLGFESYGYLLGTESRAEQWQASFAKRDPDGKLLGPFHLTEARFLYLNLPPLPLITEGKAGRGFYLSTYPLNAPSNFGTQNLEGPLTNGWEVELYRNDFLIDRQVSNSTGRYSFKNIPMQYGRNQFRLSFYGPRGERKVQYQTFYIDPSIIRPDSHDFRGGFAVLGDDRRRLSFQYEQNLFGNISAGTGILHDENPSKTYGYVGGTGFVGPFLLTSNLSASNQGQAYEIGTQTGYESLTLGGKYSQFMNGYSSELYETVGLAKLANITSANFSYILPFPFSIAMTWDISHRNYVDNSRQTILKNLLSTNTGPVYWNHEFNYFFDSNNPFRGKLDLSYLPYQTNLRLGMEYLQRGFNYIEGEGIQRIQDSYAISLLLRRQLKDEIWQAKSSVSKLFKMASVGVDFSLNSPGNYSVGLLLAYSLGFDPKTAAPYLQRDPQVPYGAATLLVFKDLNYNGKWDPGEPPIPNISLRMNQRETELASDSDGKILLSRLPAHLPVEVSLASHSFNDPFIRPSLKGLRFVPKAGSMTSLELPVATVGEIDGYVMVERRKSVKPKRGVTVELLNSRKEIVTTSRTDSDGFYVFDSISPGEYSLRLSHSQPHQNVTPAERTVRVKDEGSFESHNDFNLVE